jgi:hypothetical protein
MYLWVSNLMSHSQRKRRRRVADKIFVKEYLDLRDGPPGENCIMKSLVVYRPTFHKILKWSIEDGLDEMGT